MSVGLYSGTPGLALGTGLYKDTPGLWSGASGLISGFGSAFPTDGSPTLIIDFVPVADPVYGSTLSVDFTAQQYQTYTRDPADPTGFIDIQVWN